MPAKRDNPKDDAPEAARPMTLGTLGPAIFAVAGLVGLAGLAAGALLGWREGDAFRGFLHSYLVNYCFFLSITLGALFFVALQHATRAGWSVTVRRLAEVLAANVPCLAILFLPILISVLVASDSLYPWAAPDAVRADVRSPGSGPSFGHDALTQSSDDGRKHGPDPFASNSGRLRYLNPTAFGIRCVVYFAIWGLLGRFFLRRSVEQDYSADAETTRRLQRLSPVALLLFALTLTFAAFDWLMSLTPDWSSTIYGVYYFSGAAVAVFAVLILLAMTMQAAGRMSAATVTVEHYHDLGKLLFAFVVFRGYIAFSQYLLIWYANMPEETQWYQPRSSGAWGGVSLVLLAGNLLIPFFGLLSREVKRRKPLLAFWAVWLLAMHWIDLYWLVMPSHSPQSLPLGPIDACCLLGIGGVYLAAAVRIVGRESLVPLADPRLNEALAFENN